MPLFEIAAVTIIAHLHLLALPLDPRNVLIVTVPSKFVDLAHHICFQARPTFDYRENLTGDSLGYIRTFRTISRFSIRRFLHEKLSHEFLLGIEAGSFPLFRDLRLIDLLL